MEAKPEPKPVAHPVPAKKDTKSKPIASPVKPQKKDAKKKPAAISPKKNVAAKPKEETLGKRLRSSGSTQKAETKATADANKGKAIKKK